MSTLATDNFNRANSPNLGANWTIPTADANALPITSNEVTQGTFPAVEYYSAISWPNDQYAQLVMKSVSTTSDSGIGPAVRVTSGGNLYLAQATTVETRLYKRVSGIYTQLGSDGAGAAANDVIYIEVQGTSVLVKKNGVTVVGPVTDSAIGAGNAGIWSTNIANTADDWEGGDFAAGGAINIAPLIQNYRNMGLYS